MKALYLVIAFLLVTIVSLNRVKYYCVVTLRYTLYMFTVLRLRSYINPSHINPSCYLTLAGYCCHKVLYI